MALARKIAYINLTDGSTKIAPTSLDLREKFLGGRGINMYLLSQSYSPQLDPFSPENPLIFGAGLLTGTLGFGSRINITAKSPESGHIGDANMGGDIRKTGEKEIHLESKKGRTLSFSGSFSFR